MPYYIETRAVPSGTWVVIAEHAPIGWYDSPTREQLYGIMYRDRREAERRVRMYQKVKADFGINCEFRVVSTSHRGTSEVVE